MIFALLAGSFLACGEKEETTEEEAATCETTISGTSPASGEADFYVRDSIVFELSEEDATASITLADASGADVAGTSSLDGSTVTFTPAADLSPSTGYTASLTYCGSADPVAVDFTTSDLGGALSGSIAGNTYALDITQGTFLKPAGVGALLQDAFSNKILVGVIDDSNGELKVEGAISEEGSPAQDLCTETLVFPEAADFSSAPYFEIPEGDLTLTIAGFTATIYSLNISGMFAADGSYFGGGELRGKLDARDLVDIAADLGAGDTISSADDLCTLAAGFGAYCEACTDGAEYCLTVEVVDLTADKTDDTLVSRTAEDIAADPECSDGDDSGDGSGN